MGKLWDLFVEIYGVEPREDFSDEELEVLQLKLERTNEVNQ